MYRHSSVSCDGMGSAENSSNACLRRGAVNAGRFRQCGERMLVEGGGQRLGHVDLGGRQPTEPSIWSSIRRLSSTAYSMGSSRVMGSMNPFTIIAVASTSDRPRLIR